MAALRNTWIHRRLTQVAVLHRVLLRCCLSVVLVVLPNVVAAQTSSSVWVVSKGDSRLYIGGTLHLLSAQDYPLPTPFDVAFDAADTLVFETDIGALNSPQVQARLQSMVLLPPDVTLKNSLSAETYEQLRAYLNEVGMDVAGFNQIKPAMVAMVISVLELQKLGLGETGVDQHYYQLGLIQEKSISWVETLDAHLAYVSSMGEGYEDDFLRYTLDDMDNVGPMLGEMVSGWRSGDMAALEEQVVAPMRDAFPSVYATLLVERNVNWLPQIEQMVSSPNVELILVGVGHLVGKEGVLQMLARKGYSVERLVLP